MDFEWKFEDYETRQYRLKETLRLNQVEQFEAVLGGNGIVDVIVASRIWDLQPAVCWIENLPATGYLVAGDTIVTNHHVLRSAAESADVEVRFNYQNNAEKIQETFKAYSLDPQSFFWTSEFLDLSFVGVSGKPSVDFAPLKIGNSSPRIGAPAIIIQHPGGGLKKICLGDSEVAGVLDTGFFQYLTDTLPGSSGSPVFDDRLRLVGTHHRSILTPDGRGFFRNQGISWAAAIKQLPAEVASRIDAPRA